MKGQVVDMFAHIPLAVWERLNLLLVCVASGVGSRYY